MKIPLVTLSMLFLSGAPAQADTVRVAMKDRPVATFSDPGDIDYLRTHLVYVFDMAAHHCQEDSDSHWKPSEDEIRNLIRELSEESHLEMTFAVPTPVTIESRPFLIKRLWVSIREWDWATFDWCFETPDGGLVALSGVEGSINRQLGPMIQILLDDPVGEDSDTDD